MDQKCNCQQQSNLIRKEELLKVNTEEQILQQNPHCNGAKCCKDGVRCEFLCHKTENRCCTDQDPVSDCSASNCEFCTDVECAAPNLCVAPDNVCNPALNECCPRNRQCCPEGTICANPDDVCPEGTICADPDDVCTDGTCCTGFHNACIPDIDIPVPCIQPVPCTVVCKNPSGTDTPNSVLITILATSILGLDLDYELVAGQGPFKGAVVKGADPNQNQFTYTPNNGALGFDYFKVDISTLDNNGKKINTTRITIPVRIDPCFPPPPCDLNCACSGPDQDCECVCPSEPVNGVAE